MKCLHLSIIISLCLLSEAVGAKSQRHHIRHSSIAHSSSQSLTAAQRNNGFTSRAYADAYDAFGKRILKRDEDVKETANSTLAGYFGYYFIFKQSHIPGAEAKRHAAEYYEDFVSMRQRYFSPDQAPKCFVDVKNSNEETVASADDDGVRLGP